MNLLRCTLVALAPLVVTACSTGGVDTLNGTPSGVTGGGAAQDPALGAGGGSAGTLDGGLPGGGGTSPLATGLPCAITDVLARHCQGCHGSPPIAGAPMALMTLDDLRAALPSAPTKTVYEAVRARIHDDARPMPPTPNPRLDAKDMTTLDDWVERGAPAASETACATSPTKTDGGIAIDPLPCEPDVDLGPSTPFTMPQAAKDLYVCYGVDVPVGAKRHVVALAPRVDNATIVHHILLMEVGASVTTVPFDCGVEATNAGRIVSAWAPGGRNVVLPAEAGFPIQGTAHYMVQVHYNNALAKKDQKDRSGYRLCTTANLRPNDADIAAFGAQEFILPPRATVGYSCGVVIPEGTPPVHIFGAMPHMHQLGLSISTTAYGLAGGGTPRDLGTQAAWDFQNQAWLPVKATLSPGDSVVTRCKWQNTTVLPVAFGEGTADEMCYSFTMYYPRIPNLTWNAPASASTCVPL